MGRCRFCRETAPHGDLVQYGVRHWAHPVCLFRNKGIGAIEALHTWQLRRLPVIAMIRAGVTREQVRAWEARIEAEDGASEDAAYAPAESQEPSIEIEVGRR